MTAEEKRELHRVRTREYQRTMDQDRKREINRRWARNQDPAKRAWWNLYNRLRRADVAPPDALSREYGDVLPS